MKIPKSWHKRLLIGVFVVLFVPVVLYIVLIIYIADPFAIHPNHDKERAAIQAGYSQEKIPSSLTLVSSKWVDNSTPSDSQDYSWQYVYHSNLSRADQYRELRATFDAQGLTKPKDYNDLINSQLYGFDTKRHLQIIATFMPMPMEQNSTDPLESVEIDAYPLSE